MNIKISCYKYAPETARATVNGHPVNITNSMIPQLIATGHREDAVKEIKRIYRKQTAAENKYIYAFFRENSNQFYYIAVLSFGASADIKTRLLCYKELKHYLQANPQTITTESGYITPTGATKPTAKTEQIQINFNKCKKIRVIGG